jgi:hypothetical protein
VDEEGVWLASFHPGYQEETIQLWLRSCAPTNMAHDQGYRTAMDEEGVWLASSHLQHPAKFTNIKMPLSKQNNQRRHHKVNEEGVWLASFPLWLSGRTTQLHLRSSVLIDVADLQGHMAVMEEEGVWLTSFHPPHSTKPVVEEGVWLASTIQAVAAVLQPASSDS